MLQSALLKPVEYSVNMLLAQDPLCTPQLQRLSGKTLVIKPLPAAGKKPGEALTALVIEVSAGKILLHTITNGNPTTTIRGSIPALFQLLTAKDKKQSFYHRDLELLGDVAFLQSLQKVLTGLNIDWEFQLSRFIGDIPVQALSDSLSASANYLHQSAGSATQSLKDYLHEENNSLVSPQELSTFSDAVELLQDRVSRAAAKIALLNT